MRIRRRWSCGSMSYALVSSIAMMALWWPAPCTSAAAQYAIVTASDKGTYYRIGQDLARFIAPDADVALEVLPTSGSAANIRHLRYDPKVKLAIVQADVYQAFIDRAHQGNLDASAMIKPLRVVMPLYDTEIHYLVRADSPLEYLHDIRDARINGGLVGSGAALITHTLYRMMFDRPIPDGNATFFSNEEALVKLISDRSVDVVVVAAGQPAPLIAAMRPDARNYVKLLKFDPDHPASRAALTVYTHSVVRAASYPALLKEDFTTVAVGAYLVTYNYTQPHTVERLTAFARSLCHRFAMLQTYGHPKWREVRLGLGRLPSGWTYYSPTARELRACSATAVARPAPQGSSGCLAEERILGLCP